MCVRVGRAGGGCYSRFGAGPQQVRFHADDRSYFGRVIPGGGRKEINLYKSIRFGSEDGGLPGAPFDLDLESRTFVVSISSFDRLTYDMVAFALSAYFTPCFFGDRCVMANKTASRWRKMAMARGANKTFGELLNANGGSGPGFDLLRVGLAVSILFSHASLMAGNHHLLSSVLENILHLHGHAASGLAHAAPEKAVAHGVSSYGIARPYILARVPMFFALSGFLVTSSAFRTRNVLSFLGLRALRIFPALVVEVTLSAVFLGLLFTTLPPFKYLSHPDFLRYFGNIFGIVDFELPGVFKSGSPTDSVNGNLWTLPSELHCYIAMSVLMFARIIYNRQLFTILFGILTLGFIVANSGFGVFADDDVLSGPVILYYFVCGVLVYQWRHDVPYNLLLFVAMVAVVVALSYSNRTLFIYPIALTYVTMFIGMSNLPKVRWISSGDYSYGVYLYGFPITQAVVATLPFVRGNVFLISLIGLICTFLFSAFSWHVVEKNALKLRKYLRPRAPALINSSPSNVTAVEELTHDRVERQTRRDVEGVA